MIRLAFSDFTAGCGFPGCDDVAPLRARYCAAHGKAATGGNSARAGRRAVHELRFTGIDGEGTGAPGSHQYVLLGCGDRHVTFPRGVTSIDQPFTFLYECFQADPAAVYVGFFLGYDFDMWLRTLPRERAERLLTDAGRASRARRDPRNKTPFPVRYAGWEFDMLAWRRLKIRPAGEKRWMWICDAGPFFQQSFLSVIDPARWPEPVVSEEEFATLAAGKQRRDHAVLDQEMIAYNTLENQVLARVMGRLHTGLLAAGVALSRRQWFGPGQAAQSYLAKRVPGLDKATSIVRGYDQQLADALQSSYHGGWFEVAVHGHVPRKCHEYDLNSAYPHAITRLPCPCGTWEHGKKKMPPEGVTALVRASVRGNSLYLGPLPFRTRTGGSMRPLRCSGWWWADEIRAARRAGLIESVEVHEWFACHPCGHQPPLAGVAELYERRLTAGKNTPEGKALKLLYNSMYGKFAQSVGEPRFGNAFYASLITSGCRTAILGAIASHPRRAEGVVMVATDGVFFTTPHPRLPLSSELGDWSHTVHEHLTVFKPGIYWNDAARQRIAAGEAVAFKSRGVSAADFASSVCRVDDLFAAWSAPQLARWPVVEFTARFTIISPLQALAATRGHHDAYAGLAGQVREGLKLRQDSDPGRKRQPWTLTRDERGLWRTRPYPCHPAQQWSAPYRKSFGRDVPGIAQFHSPDGPVMLGLRTALRD